MKAAPTDRVWNFSAGPAVLPVSVLERMQSELLSYGDSGESVMEMSHRSAVFVAIFDDAVQRLRRLLNVPEGYEVLLLQGGGRLQNLMVPMNLIEHPEQTADYLVTGSWGQYSSQDAENYGRVNRVWDGKQEGYRRWPAPNEIQLSTAPAYVHYTSNETIQGVQCSTLPELNGTPVVGDFSSDFLSRPIDFSRVQLVYACAQKNAGIAGLTVVIIDRTLLTRGQGRVPGYLSYKSHVDADGMFNTPPAFAVYVTGLVLAWIEESFGDLSGMERHNEAKSDLVYQAVDRHADFYHVHANLEYRSRMNVCFTTPTADLDRKFCEEARQAGLSDLKGHRSVGGIRASLYNAMPLEGAERLAQFMDDFALRQRKAV